jgi:hypothetical protein
MGEAAERRRQALKTGQLGEEEKATCYGGHDL